MSVHLKLGKGLRVPAYSEAINRLRVEIKKVKFTTVI